MSEPVSNNDHFDSDRLRRLLESRRVSQLSQKQRALDWRRAASAPIRIQDEGGLSLKKVFAQRSALQGQSFFDDPWHCDDDLDNSSISVTTALSIAGDDSPRYSLAPSLTPTTTSDSTSNENDCVTDPLAELVSRLLTADRGRDTEKMLQRLHRPPSPKQSIEKNHAQNLSVTRQRTNSDTNLLTPARLFILCAAAVVCGLFLKFGTLARNEQAVDVERLDLFPLEDTHGYETPTRPNLFGSASGSKLRLQRQRWTDELAFHFQQALDAAMAKRQCLQDDASRQQYGDQDRRLQLAGSEGDEGHAGDVFLNSPLQDRVASFLHSHLNRRRSQKKAKQ